MSLRIIAEYSSDSDSDTESNNQQLLPNRADLIVIEKLVKNLIDNVVRKLHRQDNRLRSKTIDESEADSDESDLSPWTVDSDDDDQDDEMDNEWNKPCRTKGELDYSELPKIEKLNISSPIEQLTQLGNVTSIIDQLIIIKSFTNLPALDLDTIVFLKNGLEIGRIQSLMKLFDFI